MQNLYYYGCKSDNTDFGAVPVKGILWGEPSNDNRYLRILVYSRKLTKEEMDEFQLDYIKGPNEMVIDATKLSEGNIRISYESMNTISPSDTSLGSQKALEGR